MTQLHLLKLFVHLFVQVLASDATPEALLPYIKVFQSLIRCAALFTRSSWGSGLQLQCTAKAC
jgi:hypothetical protein